MKSTDVLFKDLTGEQLRELPQEWISLYLGRPTRSQIINAKRAMYFRSFLIATLFAFMFMHHGPKLLSVVAFCLVGYEIAYYNLLASRLENEFGDRMRTYIQDVESLPG
ncbi:hypothetical protein [Stenotrophomonas maltophilia]